MSRDSLRCSLVWSRQAPCLAASALAISSSVDQGLFSTKYASKCSRAAFSASFLTRRRRFLNSDVLIAIGPPRPLGVYQYCDFRDIFPSFIIFPSSFIIIFPSSFIIIFPSSFIIIFPSSFIIIFPSSFIIIIPSFLCSSLCEALSLCCAERELKLTRAARYAPTPGGGVGKKSKAKRPAYVAGWPGGPGGSRGRHVTEGGP